MPPSKPPVDLFGESSPTQAAKPAKKQKPANAPLSALAGVNMLGRPRPYEAIKDPKDATITWIMHLD